MASFVPRSTRIPKLTVTNEISDEDEECIEVVTPRHPAASCSSTSFAGYDPKPALIQTKSSTMDMVTLEEGCIPRSVYICFTHEPNSCPVRMARQWPHRRSIIDTHIIFTFTNGTHSTHKFGEFPGTFKGDFLTCSIFNESHYLILITDDATISSNIYSRFAENSPYFYMIKWRDRVQRLIPCGSLCLRTFPLPGPDKAHCYLSHETEYFLKIINEFLDAGKQLSPELVYSSDLLYLALKSQEMDKKNRTAHFSKK